METSSIFKVNYTCLRDLLLTDDPLGSDMRKFPLGVAVTGNPCRLSPRPQLRHMNRH